MFREICYLNTLHKCFPRCVTWIPYINVSRDVLSEHLTSMFREMCYLNTLHTRFARCVIWIPYIHVSRDVLSEYLTYTFREMRNLNILSLDFRAKREETIWSEYLAKAWQLEDFKDQTLTLTFARSARKTFGLNTLLKDEAWQSENL